MRSPGRRVLAVVALVALLGAGCRLETDLNVELADDGSGSVEVVIGVDDEALERVGGDLGAVLETDDLEAAGWQVSPPAREGDGTTRVRAERAFADAAGAADVFADLAVEGGPFRDFGVERRQSFAEVEWGFEGRVDFSGGLESLADEALADELDGQPLGESVEDLEARLGASLDRLVRVRVAVRMPGDVTSNATTTAENGAVWRIPLDAGPVALEASSSKWRTAVLAWTGAGAVLALVLVVWLLVRLARRALGRGSVPPGRHTAPA